MTPILSHRRRSRNDVRQKGKNYSKFAGQLDESNVDEKSKMVYDLINAAGTLFSSLILRILSIWTVNQSDILPLVYKAQRKEGRHYYYQCSTKYFGHSPSCRLTQLITCTATLEEQKLQWWSNTIYYVPLDSRYRKQPPCAYSCVIWCIS